MRSDQPIESAWPQDMALVIEEFPAPFMQLLYVRHAWRIENWIQVPALDPEPAVGSSARPASLSAETAAARWEAAWKQNFYWYHRPLPGSSTEEFDLAEHFGYTGPSWWFTEYGTDGIDVAAYDAWTKQLEALKTTHVFQTPERVAVDSVAAAWRKGLRSIFVMPFATSDGAEWNGVSSVTVGARTRLDPDRYPTAFTYQPA